MTTRNSTATVEPPAQAVALDAHWAAKMERLRARALPEVSLLICDDPDVKDRLARARTAVDAANRKLDAADTADGAYDYLEAAHRRAEEELAAATTAHREASIELRFRALPRVALQQLIKQHPPADDDEDDDTATDQLNTALIAASSVDGMTEDDARLLLDTWSNADARALIAAANAAQSQSRADLGKG